MNTKRCHSTVNGSRCTQTAQRGAMHCANCRRRLFSAPRATDPALRRLAREISAALTNECPMTVRCITVCIIDESTMSRLAAERGYVGEEDGPSILDLVDDYEAEKTFNCFASLTKAKDWARRHKAQDFWSSPEIVVYEYPDASKLTHQRETVQRLRLVGDGYGWEEIEP